MFMVCYSPLCFEGLVANVLGIVELEREYAATLLEKRDEEDVLDIMGRDVEDLWDALNKK